MRRDVLLFVVVSILFVQIGVAWVDETCSQECEDEFLKCMNAKMNGQGMPEGEAYDSCRGELDASFWVFGDVCVPYCTPTDAMEVYDPSYDGGDSDTDDNTDGGDNDTDDNTDGDDSSSEFSSSDGGDMDFSSSHGGDMDFSSSDGGDMDLECSEECSDEFVNCIQVKVNNQGMSADESYNLCRTQLDNQTGPLATSCAGEAGCEDTPEMCAVVECSSDSFPDNDDEDDTPTDSSSADDDDDNAEAIELSTDPVLCTAETEGRCECASDPGFTTYTFMVGDDQRCFTVYTPVTAVLPAPVLFLPNCYAADKLVGISMKSNSQSVQDADMYGISIVGVSTPNQHWKWGQDGVINDDYPAPCADEDSVDMVYIRTIMEFLVSDSSVYSPNEMYFGGSSQNSIFSAWMGYCFRDHVRGVFQSASGVAVNGEEPFSPGMEAQCKQSDFLNVGKPQCVTDTPCDGCQYSPVYPVEDPDHANFIDCIHIYEQDYLFGTAYPMYEFMEQENFDARYIYMDDPQYGGHSAPHNSIGWMVGCLGIQPVCSGECETNYLECMEGSPDELSWDKYEDCDDQRATFAGCDAHCAPTETMLLQAEFATITKSRGIFGRNSEPEPWKPEDAYENCGIKVYENTECVGATNGDSETTTYEECHQMAMDGGYMMYSYNSDKGKCWGVTDETNSMCAEVQVDEDERWNFYEFWCSEGYFEEKLCLGEKVKAGNTMAGVTFEETLKKRTCDKDACPKITGYGSLEACTAAAQEAGLDFFGYRKNGDQCRLCLDSTDKGYTECIVNHAKDNKAKVYVVDCNDVAFVDPMYTCNMNDYSDVLGSTAEMAMKCGETAVGDALAGEMTVAECNNMAFDAGYDFFSYREDTMACWIPASASDDVSCRNTNSIEANNWNVYAVCGELDESISDEEMACVNMEGCEGEECFVAFKSTAVSWKCDGINQDHKGVDFAFCVEDTMSKGLTFMNFRTTNGACGSIDECAPLVTGTEWQIFINCAMVSSNN